MSKQSRRDLAIHYPVTSYCCCFEEERRRTDSTEILDSIKKQHLLRKPHIQLLTYRGRKQSQMAWKYISVWPLNR